MNGTISERTKQILEILLNEKKVTVSDLAKRLYSSEPSIRRDLTFLAKQNLIRRIHGGAIIEENSESRQKIPFILRELEQSDEKVLMASKAAELVRDGDTVMLDASTSAFNMIPYLAAKNGITVITSGVKALAKLGELGVNTYSTGGHLLPSCQSLVGDDACATIKKYNADIVFFSCRGLSENGMLTDLSIEENIVRKQMLLSSKRSVFLCGSKKFDKTYLHNLCHISEITNIISDMPLPDKFKTK